MEMHLLRAARIGGSDKELAELWHYVSLAVLGMSAASDAAMRRGCHICWTVIDTLVRSGDVEVLRTSADLLEVCRRGVEELESSHRLLATATVRDVIVAYCGISERMTTGSTGIT